MSKPMNGRQLSAALVIFVALLAACAGTGPSTQRAGLGAPPDVRIAYTAAVPGSCHANGALPDPTCTPGAADPRVTQANIQTTICKSGYTATVRPPVSTTDAIKTERMAAYGITASQADVELDHLIPLEAGGSSEVANLWPQSRLMPPGMTASDKDKTENATRKAICDGMLSLADAQAKIAKDWVALRAELMAKGTFAAFAPGTLVPTEP